eukprot:jgi/Mesvir1/21196/Mv21543-RA.1
MTSIDKVEKDIQSEDPNRVLEAIAQHKDLVKSLSHTAAIHIRNAMMKAAVLAGVEKSENRRYADGHQVVYERLRDAAKEFGRVWKKGQVPTWVSDKFRDMSSSFLTMDIQRALRYEGDLDTKEANAAMGWDGTPPPVPEIDPLSGRKTGRTVPKFWVWGVFEGAGVEPLSLQGRLKAIRLYMETMSASNASAAKKLAWARNYDLLGQSKESSVTAPVPAQATAQFDTRDYAESFRSRDPQRLMHATKLEMAMKEVGVDALTLHEAIPKDERIKCMRDALIKAAAARGEELAVKGDLDKAGLFDELLARAGALGYVGGEGVRALRAYRDMVRDWLTPGAALAALRMEKETMSRKGDAEMTDGPVDTVAVLNPDTGRPTRAVRPVSWAWHWMGLSGIPGLAMNKRVEKVEAARDPEATKLAWSLHYQVAEQAQVKAEEAIVNQPTPDKVSVKDLDGTLVDVRCGAADAMASSLVDMWKTGQFKVIPRDSFAFAKCHAASDALRSKFEDPANALTADVRKKKIADYVRGLRATGSPADLEMARQFRDRFAEVGLFATPEELWQLSAPADPSAAVPEESATTEKKEDGYRTENIVAVAGILVVVVALVSAFLFSRK